MIDPIEEAKSGYTFLSDLARGLGYGQLFLETDEDWLKFAFEAGPVSLQALESHPEGVRWYSTAAPDFNRRFDHSI
jgi:hypothetical protein